MSDKYSKEYLKRVRTVSILSKILEEKKREVSCLSVNDFSRARANKPRSLKESLQKTPFPSVIAEIKKASPSKGDIRSDLNPVTCAEQYLKAGCAAISVLTDKKFFKGDIEFLPEIRAAFPSATLLRKDFIIDEVQLLESFDAGADAVLLIAKALDPLVLGQLFKKASELKLSSLVEVHSIEELNEVLEQVDTSSPYLNIGVNNRDLNTFETSHKTTALVANELKQKGLSSLPLISESGISTSDDLISLNKLGATSFLIGEALVREGDPGENLQNLINNAQR